MTQLNQLEAWFVTGSQHLYGEETLNQVDRHSRSISEHFNNTSSIPVSIIFKPVVKTPEEILRICQEANTAPNCIGIVAWMHTFSPAKMWIGGLKALQKPLVQLNTQFNRDIPWAQIDMDFMNLNQSAHGDREFGFILSRMRINRKVVVGHWQDEETASQLGIWSRAAAAWYDSQRARLARFGDNMRYVAVTEGDKVEAELVFGYSVNGYGMGDLVKIINEVNDGAIDATVQEYEDLYVVMESLRKGGDRHDSLREAAKIEIGLRHFLEAGHFTAFTDTFEDLHGIGQLPGLAVQRLMNEGYGFAAEGDWKTSALVHTMKTMAQGLTGGNSFMEDYTYHFNQANAQVLGSHMLEICESIASHKPSCEIHPLGIGGKADPVRLVFNSAPCAAINVSVVDMGNRFRILVNEVEAVNPEFDLPKLPVARVLWKPLPDMKTACTAWILAGGAHHSCYSQNLQAEYILDFAEMAGVECVLIGKDTNLHQFKKELIWNDMYYHEYRK